MFEAELVPSLELFFLTSRQIKIKITVTVTANPPPKIPTFNLCADNASLSDVDLSIMPKHKVKMNQI